MIFAPGAKSPGLSSRSSPDGSASGSVAPRRRLSACWVLCTHSWRCRAAHQHPFTKYRAVVSVAAVLPLERRALTGLELHASFSLNGQYVFTRPHRQCSRTVRPLRTADTEGAPGAWTMKKGRSKRKIRMMTQNASHRTCLAGWCA